MNKLNLICVVLVGIVLQGCASTSFRPVVQPQSDAFADTRALDEKANQLKADDVKDIIVMSALPAGISGANGAFSSTPDSGYEIIGKVSTGTNGNIGDQYSWNTTPWYFYPFSEDESGRSTYCHIQVPLVWITLGLWSVFNPMYYPCWTVDTNKDSDIQNRKNRIKIALQKGAKVLGGDSIVFLDSSGTKTMNTTMTNLGGTGVMMGHSTESNIEWTHGVALVLKKKK